MPDPVIVCEFKTCKRPASTFRCGQWVCPTHAPTGAANCSHSLAPSGSCAYCGADVPAQ